MHFDKFMYDDNCKLNYYVNAMIQIKYKVSPFLESFRMSRSDGEFSPFIFLLPLQGPKHSFYVNLESWLH